MSLRKKLADNESVLNWFARRIAGYIRLVHKTSRWTRIGFEPMDAVLDSGEPVIIVLWHQRLTMTPYFFPVDKFPICSLTSAARAGSMVGRVQTEFNFQTIAMSSHTRHVALSRKVLGKLKEGVTIGIAADGPRGPARVCSAVPLMWARTSGKRVFCVTYSAKHGTETGMWDRLLLPRPKTEGVYICREWTRTVPRKASAEEIEDLRLDLQQTLNDISREADEMMGRTPFDESSYTGDEQPPEL